MIPVLAVAIAFAVVAYRLEGDQFMKTESATVGLMVGLFFGVIGSMAIGVPFHKNEIITETTEIKTVQDNAQLNGSFFLIAGSVNQEPVFTVYAKQGQGWQLRNLPADDWLVVEQQTSNPRLESTKRIASGTCNNWIVLCPSKTNRPIKQNIIVPPNSIATEFNLDATLN